MMKIVSERYAAQNGRVSDFRRRVLRFFRCQFTHGNQLTPNYEELLVSR